MRSFGIDASTPVGVATEVARRAEDAGYDSFWVNGSPHAGALNIIEAAAEVTRFDLGVGVFPLTHISAGELVDEVRNRALPSPRLWLGIGSARRPGALEEVRSASELLRTELDLRIVMGAVGPNMTNLAGEIADAVIFTWWIAPEVERSRVLLDEGASAAGRESPTVISFIRCALLPEAADAVAERASAYSAIPHYKAVFDRNNMTAADTIVTGPDRAELLSGIRREEAVLDMSVIRAIPASPDIEHLSRLVAACAPQT